MTVERTEHNSKVKAFLSFFARHPGIALYYILLNYQGKDIEAKIYREDRKWYVEYKNDSQQKA